MIAGKVHVRRIRVIERVGERNERESMIGVDLERSRRDKRAGVQEEGETWPRNARCSIQVAGAFVIETLNPPLDRRVSRK